jgi:REP element-mobilizing transposase RayT
MQKAELRVEIAALRQVMKVVGKAFRTLRKPRQQSDIAPECACRSRLSWVTIAGGFNVTQLSRKRRRHALPRPIVIAYHLIWTAYGTWLANDPRGSGSNAVQCSLLAELGDLHHGRKNVQPARQVVREFYERAEACLRFPVIRYDAAGRELIALGIADAIAAHRYTCYACAIMPDHVHLIIRKHKYLAEDMIDHLQTASRLRLSDSPSLPYDHPIWTQSGWKVFLDSPEHVWSVIRYIERNPMKAGLPKQHWPHVKPYDNWPFHEGHSPTSPYARRLSGHT